MIELIIIDESSCGDETEEFLDYLQDHFPTATVLAAAVRISIIKSCGRFYQDDQANDFINNLWSIYCRERF